MARTRMAAIGMLTTSAIVAMHEASSADTEKPPPMSAISRSTSCEDIVEPTIATAITPIVVIATESGGWAATVCVVLVPAARSLIAGPSPAARKIEEAEQDQPADDRHMLQACRQFVPELRSAAEPEAVPEQCGRNRKAGEQQRAQPCQKARGDEASADKLSKDGRTRESRRPRQSVTLDLFDARLPMPQLIEPAIEKHGSETKPGDQEPVLSHPFLLL